MTISDSRAEILIGYLNALNKYGYSRNDEKVKALMKELDENLVVLNVPIPVKDKDNALVIVLKDVTGSIGIWESERFTEYYELAISEIEKRYKDVRKVFIQHHTEAKEISEKDFYGVCESGGTIVSSGLRKVIEFLNTDREVIVIQFSDGDNLTTDCQRCLKLMAEDILPKVKYFKYVETNQYGRKTQLRKLAYDNLTDENFEVFEIVRTDDSLKGKRFGDELDTI